MLHLQLVLPCQTGTAALTSQVSNSGLPSLHGMQELRLDALMRSLLQVAPVIEYKQASR